MQLRIEVFVVLAGHCNEKPRSAKCGALCVPPFSDRTRVQLSFIGCLEVESQSWRPEHPTIFRAARAP